MIKQQAHYRVTIYSNEGTVIITDPITCHFNITRAVLSDNNRATIQLYNLAPSTREQIFQDVFTIDQKKFKYVHLEAGYGDTLSLIFKGRILQAYSHKSGGQTDVITEIQACALDIFDCQSSYTFKAGTTKKEALQTMVLDMPNVKLTNVGNLNGVFLTDTTFDGNTMECLSKLTGGTVFVDNGEINCIQENEVIDVSVPVISDDSVLLETPRRRDANLEIKMIFHPDLIVNQLLEIKSRIFTNYNGQFKVIGFTHDCTISGSEGGTRTTTVNLWIGPFLPQATVQSDTQQTQQEQDKKGFIKVKGWELSPVNPKSVGRWLKPVNGTITSQFGGRVKPNAKASSNHQGMDIACNPNTPIKATQSGYVVMSKYLGNYGKIIEINHGLVNGINVTSRYAHLNYLGVVAGEKVKQGQVIGKSGSTGNVTGPHLHFEIRENGRAVDPRTYVKGL